MIIDDERITEYEFTALALAGDPDAPLPDDAVSIYELDGADVFDPLLPEWYMPRATSTRASGWRATVIAAVITGFLFVAASGFCITYGVLQVV